MGVLDWSIVVLFLVIIVGAGIYSMRYVRGVTDFLACGRVCGRYVICVADMANGLALGTMIGTIEAGYKSGLAYSFWGALTLPVSLFLSLSGFVFYRFRQTKAMSFGQFIEMRYSRRLRIFASTLRSISEMLANMILPALAGRFFICLLDLPQSYTLCGITISTYMTVMFVCLALAISMILFGGSVTLVITDTIQGLVAYPVMALMVGFVLWKFSWDGEIAPLLMDRPAGESFLNPYDIEHLRDFNLAYVVFALFQTIMNRGIGMGAGGGTCAAKSPHEQKMAGILGTWRGGFSFMFYLTLTLLVIVFLNHQDFAHAASDCRKKLSALVTQEIIADPQMRQKVMDKISAIPVSDYVVGESKPLSLKKNLDTPYIDAVALVAAEHPEAELKGKVPEFRTLFHQLMLPSVLRNVLPPGMMGIFCALVILMIISTDDSRIYSASLTLSQDLVLPLLKKSPSPRCHINIIRWVTIGVGVFFFVGSIFTSQLEYITLFVMIMYGIWAAGAGIIVLGGLYTRFGTTQGAWSALLSGSGAMVAGIFIQRNWAGVVYPWLQEMQWVDGIGAVLSLLSRPLNPYVEWVMTPYRCPINAVELSFLCSILSIVVYCVVSACTCRTPFNLDRMLHRGKYNLDGTNEVRTKWSVRTVFSKIIGITPEYTRGDRLIARSVFFWSFGIGFCLTLGIVIWNAFDPWTIRWWSTYYEYRYLILSAIVAVITTVWFTIGGAIDLRNMFRDLKNRAAIDNSDNGEVSGHVSLSDKKKFEELEQRSK